MAKLIIIVFTYVLTVMITRVLIMTVPFDSLLYVKNISDYDTCP